MTIWHISILKKSTIQNVTIECNSSNKPEDYTLGTFSCEEFLQHLIGKGIIPIDENEAERPHALNTVRELYEL